MDLPYNKMKVGCWLLKWFKQLPKSLDQRHRIFDLVEDHLKIVKQMADQMMNICQPFSDINWRELDKIWGIMDVLESEADQAHKSIVTTICEGSYFGGIFSELLLLVDKIDNIADSAKDATRMLTQREPDEAIVKCLTKTDDLSRFLEKCRDTVYALDDAVKGLSVNRQAALERTHRIKEHEEDADLFKSRLLKALFGECQSKDALGIVQLQSFINTADEIADNAKDASDIILILIIRGYG